jgi:hypothetical protein
VTRPWQKIRGIINEFYDLDAGKQPQGGALPNSTALGAAVAAPPQQAVPVYAVAQPVAQPGAAETTASQQACEKIVAELERAVGEAPSPAFPTFRTVLSAMNTIPDEALRYQTALSVMAAAHKTDPAAVLGSLDQRLQILEQEQAEFEAVMDAEAENTIGATRRQIAEIEQRIAALQEEIRTLVGEADRKRGSIQADSSRIDRARADFASSYAVVQTRLLAEREKIARHSTSTR